MADRSQLMLDGIDLAECVGLEIGPLTTPAVTPEMGRIEYLDHTDTEGLRKKYAEHRDVDIDRIVDVDHVWTGGSLVDAVGGEGRFDYVVAAHVVEHVPDLISWLEQIRDILVPGGVLSLAVPDQRRCFDAFRRPTTTAEVLEAWLEQRTRPSPRQVFDHYAGAVARHGQIAWLGAADPDELRPVHDEQQALDAARRSARGDYVDVHCWVFTPDTFRSLIASLGRIGLIGFTVDELADTDGTEFLVRLRSSSGEPGEQRSEPVTDSMAVDLGRRSAQRERDLTGQVAALTERAAALQAELDATMDSLSWRVTAPLRELNRRARITGGVRRSR